MSLQRPFLGAEVESSTSVAVTPSLSCKTVANSEYVSPQRMRAWSSAGVCVQVELTCEMYWSRGLIVRVFMRSGLSDGAVFAASLSSYEVTELHGHERIEVPGQM